MKHKVIIITENFSYNYLGNWREYGEVYSTDETESLVFSGSLSECYACIKLSEEGYISIEREIRR